MARARTSKDKAAEPEINTTSVTGEDKPRRKLATTPTTRSEEEKPRRRARRDEAAPEEPARPILTPIR
ncbi:MAG: transcription termination factor Rho, partial [Myxococcaceae bacterium]